MTSAAKFRAKCRSGEFSGICFYRVTNQQALTCSEGNTANICAGMLQANLVVLESDWASDFLSFTRRNPQACPLLEMTETGCYEAR